MVMHVFSDRESTAGGWIWQQWVFISLVIFAWAVTNKMPVASAALWMVFQVSMNKLPNFVYFVKSCHVVRSPRQLSYSSNIQPFLKRDFHSKHWAIQYTCKVPWQALCIEWLIFYSWWGHLPIRVSHLVTQSLAGHHDKQSILRWIWTFDTLLRKQMHWPLHHPYSCWEYK